MPVLQATVYLLFTQGLCVKNKVCLIYKTHTKNLIQHSMNSKYSKSRLCTQEVHTSKITKRQHQNKVYVFYSYIEKYLVNK